MLVAKANVSSEIKLQELPEEIVPKVLGHLSSLVDAISFAKTSRSIHNLVAHEVSYWSLHGATKISSTLPSLASTWASRARSLPSELRNVLPRLRGPLDVSSGASVVVLFRRVQDIHTEVERTQDGYNFDQFWNSWRRVLESSDKAGLEPPDFPSEALDLFVEQMPSAITQLSVASKQMGRDTQLLGFLRFSDVAGYAGVKFSFVG